MGKKLAIDGGSPVTTDSIPVGIHGLSVIDEQEINAVTKAPKFKPIGPQRTQKSGVLNKNPQRYTR